jgi:Leucine-rich repeat (LRR) protein
LKQASEQKFYFGKEKINITNSTDWIIINHFEGQSYYTISVLENENDEPRKNRVILKGKDRTRVIDIIQEGQDITSKFECEEFRKLLKYSGCIRDPQLIRVRDVKNVKKMDLQGPDGIESFAGLEYFKALELFKYETAKSTENRLEIDFSENKKLKNIDISGVSIRKIDIGSCPDLEEISCTNTLIDTLDISKNMKLRKLKLWSHCPNLEKNYKGLRAIIFPVLEKENPLLEELYCGGADISDLDLYKCPDLKKIDCLQSGIVNLDLRECFKLEHLVCSGNKIKYLDLRDCHNLETLKCNDSDIERIRFGKNRKLTGIDCNNNILTELEISALDNLEYLDCSYNRLTLLNVSANKKIKELYCRKQISKWTIVENGRGGSLRELILPDNLKQEKGLTILKLDDNKMESLDTSKNPCLEELDCQFNNLKNLDLSNNSKLKIVNCGYNYIRRLDFSNNEDLLELDCGEQGYQWIRLIDEERNLLNYLDLPDQQYNKTGTRLKKSSIKGSDLKTPIDIKNLPELEYLDYSDNGLMSLDVTHNPNLTELVCYSNNLKTLDLTKNPNLEYLDISWNKIKQIDLSNNLKLKIITCVDKYKKDKSVKTMTVYLSKDILDGSIKFTDAARYRNSPEREASPVSDYIRIKTK